VIGEPTGLKPIRMHKGIMMERIDILGRSGHSSPRLGHSALEAMHGDRRTDGLRRGWQREVPQSAVQRAHTDPELWLHPWWRQPNHLRPVFAGVRPAPAAGHGPEQLRAEIRGKLNPLAERHEVKIDYAPLFPVPPFEQAEDAELAQRRTPDRSSRRSGGVRHRSALSSALGCETIVLGPGDIACAPARRIPRNVTFEPTVRLLRDLIRHYCLS
jgi:acetylornithine deacetylase